MNFLQKLAVKTLDGILGESKEERIRQVRHQRILESFQRGIFEQYYLTLESSYHHINWKERIEEIVKLEHPSKNFDSEIYLLFLFSYAVDPELNDHTKIIMIKKTLDESSESERRTFYRDLGLKHPTIATNILKYIDKDYWQQMSYYDEEQESFRLELISSFWINEILSNRWKKEEQQQFLEQLLQSLQHSRVDVLYQYMMEHFSRVNELKDCSEWLKTIIDDLELRVTGFEEKYLSTFQVEHLLLDIPFKGKQREYFLKKFSMHMNQEQSYLFAIKLHPSDWEWLSKSLRVQLSASLLSWIVQSLKAFENGKMQENSELDTVLSSFISQASTIVMRSNQREENTEEILIRICGVLQNQNVFKFFRAFDCDLQDRLSLIVIKNQLQYDWLSFLLIEETQHDDALPSKLLSRFLLKLKQQGCLQEMFKFLVSSNPLSNFQTLVVFCYLDEESQQAFLSHIISNPQYGATILLRWVDILLNASSLKPYFFDRFLFRLHDSLRSIDSKAPFQCKQELAMADVITSSEYGALLLNVMFPLDSESDNEKERHLHKLHFFLLRENSLKKGKKKLSDEIIQQISGLDDRSKWLPGLFDLLPKPLWPLLFYYYRGFSETPYVGYWEENGLGVYRNDAPQYPKVPEWLNNLETWHEIGFGAMEHLLNLSNETCEDAVTQLYVALAETDSLRSVIQKMIEKGSRKNFIPIMKRFGKYIYPSRIKLLKDIIFTTLNEAEVDKARFMAECLANNQDCLYSYNDLEGVFWDAPFVNNGQDLCDLTKQLHEVKGNDFCHFFIQRSTPSVSMAKALYQFDQVYFFQLFQQCIESLSSDTKRWSFEVVDDLHKICEIFSDASGVLTELLQKISDSQFQSIKKHYEQFLDVHLKYAGRLLETKIGFQILQWFNEKQFFPVVLKKLENLLDKEDHLAALSEFLVNLKKFGFEEEIIKQLNDPKYHSLLKQLKENILKAFPEYCAKREVFSLICLLIPEWEEILQEWMFLHSAQEEEDALTHRRQPNFSQIRHVLVSLKQNNKLEEFLSHLPKSEQSEKLAVLVNK
ncbi:MAG: hypothetical protein Tsb0021_01670 [Chlamydiales bacterium]